MMNCTDSKGRPKRRYDSEFDALCAAGQVPDMKTMIGLQWLQRWKAGGWPLDWIAAA